MSPLGGLLANFSANEWPFSDRQTDTQSLCLVYQHRRMCKSTSEVRYAWLRVRPVCNTGNGSKSIQDSNKHPVWEKKNHSQHFLTTSFDRLVSARSFPPLKLQADDIGVMTSKRKRNRHVFMRNRTVPVAGALTASLIRKCTMNRQNCRQLRSKNNQRGQTTWISGYLRDHPTYSLRSFRRHFRVRRLMFKNRFEYLTSCFPQIWKQ